MKRYNESFHAHGIVTANQANFDAPQHQVERLVRLHEMRRYILRCLSSALKVEHAGRMLWELYTGQISREHRISTPHMFGLSKCVDNTRFLECHRSVIRWN